MRFVRRDAAPPPPPWAEEQVIAAARRLWTERPFAEVSVEDVAAQAGTTPEEVTAHFPALSDLFAAVYRAVGDEVSHKAAVALSAEQPEDLLRQGVGIFLELFTDPATQKIMLVEAPVALGWHRWRRLGSDYGTMLIEVGLLDIMDKGAIPEQPVKPLGMVIAGMLEQAALYVSMCENREQGMAEARAILDDFVRGLIRER